MQKFKYIYKIFLILIIIVSVKFTACEQEDLDFYINCYDCLTYLPDSADLIVYVTINDDNPFVPLVFYEGDYEDNVIDYVDTTWNDTLYLYSEVGKTYAVKATYKRDEETVVAIDGDKMRVVDGEGECYPPCYIIRGGTLDLTLK